MKELLKDELPISKIHFMCSPSEARKLEMYALADVPVIYDRM